jgi:hypothetical protein
MQVIVQLIGAVSVTVTLPIFNGGVVTIENSNQSYQVTATAPATIVVPDSVVDLENTQGTTLQSVSLPATEGLLLVAPDATYNLDNTEGSTLFLGSIAASDNETIIAPDGTGNVKNSANATVATGLVPSGGSANITAPDGTILINGDSSFPTIPSGGLENILVENTQGSPVGSFDINSNSWVIGDATAVVVNSANEVVATANIAAEQSGNVTAPNANWQLVNQFGQPLQTGSIPSNQLGTISIIQRPYIILVKTDNVGTSASNQFTIPTTGASHNYVVEWGDGNINVGVTGNITHTYAIAGTYQIKIYGQFPRIFFNNGGDRLKLLEIQQWGDIVWFNFADSFNGCENLNITATDLPNSTNVSSWLRAFTNCSSLVWSAIVNNINMTNNNNYSGMFNGATLFNQYVGDWVIIPTLSNNFAGTFRNTSMSTENYTDTIVGWANTIFNQGGLPTNITMLNQLGRTFQNSRSGGANFINAGAARDYLVTILGWTIGGDTVIP